MRSLILVALAFALTSCSRSFEVSVSFRGDSPVFEFSRTGVFSSEDIDVCVWMAEVVDTQAGKGVIRISPRQQDDCVRVGGLDLGALPRQGLDVSVREELKPGRTYHMEVIAEEGIGRSREWSLPG